MLEEAHQRRSHDGDEQRVNRSSQLVPGGGKAHRTETMWKSGMLARRFDATCMDMPSVGVCDRMSVHTLTPSAGKKESLSSISLDHAPVQIYFPNTL